MKVLIDTNIWISFMIGKRLSSLNAVLNNNNVQVYVCKELLDEIKEVTTRPKFTQLISSETRYYAFEMIYDTCRFAETTVEAVSPIRDLKDVYLLSFAESVPVDYIVSGDKDLKELKEHNGIPILSYPEFLNKINEL